MIAGFIEQVQSVASAQNELDKKIQIQRRAENKNKRISSHGGGGGHGGVEAGLKSRTDLNHGGFTPESNADVVFQGFRRLKCRNPFRKEGKSRRNDSIIAFSGNIEKSTKFRFSLKQR